MAGPFKLKSGNSPLFKQMASSEKFDSGETHFLERKTSIPMETHGGGDPTYKPTLKSKPKPNPNPNPNPNPKTVKSYPVPLHGDVKIPKTKVSKGDVLQTLVAPNVNIPKTLKVVEHYTPPKVKEKVKKVIKKGKSLYGKAKKYLQSDA